MAIDWESMEDEDIVSKVVEDFKKAEDARRPYEDKWLRFYKLYRNYKEDRVDNKANLHIPYTFSVVETVVPRIISTLFASRPYIGYLPTNSDSVDRAKNMEALVDYQLVQKVGFVTVATEWIKSALIYGNGILKVGWQFEESDIVKREPIKILGVNIGSRPVLTTEVTKDEPIVECIDIFDFYISPGALSIDDAPYVIHKVVRSKEYLEDMAEKGLYENIEDIEDETTETGIDMRLSELGISGGDKKGITLYEYWTNDRLITVANESVVIRNIENPYWLRKKPFVNIVDTIDPHNFYGIGEIEPIEDLQAELNTVRNMRMDNINLIINRMFTVLRHAGIDPEQLIARPGGMIEVNDHDDIRPLQLENVTSASYKEDELIRHDIDITSGVNNYVRGTNPDRRETATTSSVLSQASNERIKLKATIVEDMGLRRLGLWLASLNMQFVDRPYTVRLLGDGGVDFTELTNDDINGDFDVMPLGSAVDPVVNKGARLNSLIQLYQVFKDNPFVNPVQFTKKILEVADIKDENMLNLAAMNQYENPQQSPQEDPNIGLNPGMTGIPDEVGRLING